MANDKLDAATITWREMFAKLVTAKFENQEKLLVEICEQGKIRNNRVRKNELAIAGLRMWVTLVGSVVGLIGIAVALLQALK